MLERIRKDNLNQNFNFVLHNYMPLTRISDTNQTALSSILIILIRNYLGIYPQN